MSFHNQFAMADTLNQIKPQQLSNNVFFGPLNTLSQQEFLFKHQIKFFIAVGIPTKKAAEYYHNMPIKDFIMVNIDGGFDRSPSSNDELQRILHYNQANSDNLKQLLANINTSSTSEHERCLTPQPDLNQLMYRNINEYTTNTITLSGVQKFESFNDFLTLFKMSGLGNVLVFSTNGNDEELVTLLISHVLKMNASVSLLEAFNYVKSLRPTVNDLRDEQIFWCAGLVDYSERVRAKELFWGPGSNGGVVPNVLSFSTKRRNEPSNDNEEEGKHQFVTTVSSSPRRIYATPRAKRMATHPMGQD